MRADEEGEMDGATARRQGGGDLADEPSAVLLGTVEDWFASALRAVLEPEDFTVYRAHSSEEVLSFLARMQPDLVLLDDKLPPVDLPELTRLLLDGPLPHHVPLLYHFSRGGGSGREVAMLQAGAWGVFEDPIRPSTFVAQIRRYLGIGRRMRKGRKRCDHVDPETEVLTLTGLLRLLPALSNLARRRDASVTYTVIGPTEPGSGRLLERQRRRTAELCRRHLRKSDFVGWLEDGRDMAVITYGTSRTGAGDLARRLNDVVEEQTRTAELRYTLSAGILEVEPPRRGAEARRNGDRDGRSLETEMKLESLHALAAAQTALEKARRAGGGIRFADVK
ncbi:MAG: hypothetical protein ACOC83_07310 [Gemmatimonadota bacterium]